MMSSYVRRVIVLAIAMTTDRVKVDKTKEPFKTSPANLFNLRFNDERVGITDEQMKLFKKRLKKRLSIIGKDVDSIPNDASQRIRAVAETMLKALRRHLGTMKGEKRDEEQPAEMVHGDDPEPPIIRPGSPVTKASGAFESVESTAVKMSAPINRKKGTDPDPPKRKARSSARLPAKPVVNTGFAPQSSPAKRLGPSLPLSSNENYYFWLEVGKRLRGSIEVKSRSLPVKHLPRGAVLKVALFDFNEGLRVTPGADVGEIQLQPDSTAAVVRQPVEVQDLSSDSELLAKRLFFPVRTSERLGIFRLRCNIYYEQILVQSRLVSVRVMRRPTATKRALGSIVDYTLSRTLSPTHVARMEPHRLSLMLNDNGNGTHGFRFFGENEFKNDASFDGQELQNLITLARGRMRKAAWGDDQPWKAGKAYLYDSPPNSKRFKADLINFALWGYTFYDAIINRLAGSTEQSDKLTELMRTPGLIQIALKQSARDVLPAAMIYDYPIDTNLNPDSYTLCPTFLQSLNIANVALEDTGCFNGNCPTRDSASVVCPSGFWGYRHSLGMPLSLKGTSDAPSEIVWKGKPELTVGVSTDVAFKLRPQHETALQALSPHPGWNYANTRADLLKLLREKSSHLVYFYCHGGKSGTVPFIQVGPTSEQGITRDNLRREKIRWKSPRPLVFINGCHTADLEPDVAIEFISAFVEVAGACGVIGTEITIFETLARAFAEECLSRFLKGDKIGDAVRGARLKLLKDSNPLGIVYIPYVIASLRLTEQPANK